MGGNPPGRLTVHGIKILRAVKKSSSTTALKTVTNLEISANRYTVETTVPIALAEPVGQEETLE